MSKLKILFAGTVLSCAILFYPASGRAESAQAIPDAAVAAPNSSISESVPAFGKRGQWYLKAPTLYGQRDRYDPSTGNLVNGTWWFGTEVEGGRFVRDHFSVGLDLSYSGSSTDLGNGGPALHYGSWNAGAHVVLGWQRPLSSWASFWPSLLLGGSYFHNEQPGTITYDTQSKTIMTAEAIEGTISAPLLLHVSRHLFITVAWSLNVAAQTSAGANSMRLSATTAAGLGGWL